VDLCRDDIQIFRFLLKNPVFKKNYSFYDYLAIVYEKNHDFKNADIAFKEGFENKVENLDLLQKKYKLFEERMEVRINRDISSSEINPEVINKHLQEALNKKATELMGDSKSLNVGIKRKHCDIIPNNQIINKNDDSIHHLNYNKFNNSSPFLTIKEPNLEILNQRNFEFVIKKQKIEIVNNNITDPNNPLNTNTFYGQIPIYIDSQFRNEIITKAGKLVEIYEIISNFLLLNDKKYKLNNDEFNSKLKNDSLKKPFSILQTDRNIIEKAERISLSINNESENIIKESNILEKNDEVKKKDDCSNDILNYKKKNLDLPNQDNKNKIKENLNNNKDSNINIISKLDHNLKNNDKKLKTDNNPNLDKIDLIINNLIEDNNKIKIPEEKKICENTENFKNLMILNQEVKNDNKHTLKNPENFINNEYFKNKKLETEKVRYVKVEKNKSMNNINFINIKKKMNNKNKKFLSITQCLIKGYYENLKIIKLNEEEKDRNQKLLKEKNLRKTQIYFIDSDGDVEVNSEDNLDNYYSDVSNIQSLKKQSKMKNDYQNQTIKFLNEENKLGALENNLKKEERITPSENINFCKIKNEKNDFKEEKITPIINKNHDHKIPDQNKNNNTIRKNFNNPLMDLLEESEVKILDLLDVLEINIEDIFAAINYIEDMLEKKLITNEKKDKYTDKLEMIYEKIMSKNIPTKNSYEATNQMDNKLVDLKQKNNDTNFPKINFKIIDENINNQGKECLEKTLFDDIKDISYEKKLINNKDDENSLFLYKNLKSEFNYPKNIATQVRFKKEENEFLQNEVFNFLFKF